MARERSLFDALVSVDDNGTQQAADLDERYLTSGVDAADQAAVELYCPRTNVLVQVSTTFEELRVRTLAEADLPAGSATKAGARYVRHSGLCLAFGTPSVVLAAGEKLTRTVTMRFDAGADAS